MFWPVILLTALITLQGCAQPPQPVAPAPEPEAKVEAVIPPKKSPPAQVEIFVSEKIPAYTDVAKAIGKQLGRHATLHYLSGNQLENMKAVAQFRNENNTQIVSIGLNASIVTKTLAGNQVVFCQVFNYQDYSLLTPRHKGVSMLPSFSKTFGTWRTLSPKVTDIGVISGPGFDEAIRLAKAAAQTHGFKLHAVIVNSDKEYQYAFKKLGKQVQGYWLIPDNRVLSEHILRDVMTYSVRNSKQVVVFSEELLKLGGLFSIRSNYREVAQQVVDRLEQAQGKDTIPGPDIVYLDKLDLHINPVMAHNLDIKIPVQLMKYASAP
jgi:ABC-type uncharacterized transport system substrate-binding protein